jgi:predicted amidophosphoribosyltransferase
MNNDFSTYTPSCIRDLESAGYYDTLICQGCKKQWVEMTVDGRCGDCGEKIIVCPF